jgi:hypothetical protein
VAGYVGLAVTLIDEYVSMCDDYSLGGILIMLSGLIRWALAIAFIVSDEVPHTARYTWLTTLRAGAFMLPVWRVL